MQSVNPIYELGNPPYSVNFLHGVLLGSREMINGGNSFLMSSSSTAETKENMTANKSHSEAERRRRKRINDHLATLRTLLPKGIKLDKASLLAEVVRCLRELKKNTAELAFINNNESSYTTTTTNTGREYKIFPSETDELKLSYCDGDSGTVKASLCCDDRPELVSELMRAFRSVQAKVVRAEMATVGGRAKNVLWVQVAAAGDEGLGMLRRALNVVVDKAALLHGSSQGLPGNKRPPLYCY